MDTDTPQIYTYTLTGFFRRMLTSLCSTGITHLQVMRHKSEHTEQITNIRHELLDNNIQVCSELTSQCTANLPKSYS